MATEIPKLLITGFTPFPGAPVNPTQKLIEWLEDIKRGFDAEITAVLLETAYEPLDGVLKEWNNKLRPDIIIHFGLAAEAKGFRLERCAQNRVSTGSPDARGFAPAEAILGEVSSLPSTLPIEQMANALQAYGLPYEVSDDAGDYVCNYTFYRSCSAASDSHRPRLAGFIHIPHLDSDLPLLEVMSVTRPEQSITKDQLMVGVGVIISECLRYL